MLGPYKYSESTIENMANEDVDGVYYLFDEDEDVVLYVGKSFRVNGGIRDRLLEHLRTKNWVDVDVFYFQECQNENETDSLEKEEIKRWKPKYNDRGK